ncbi:MAG TPA: aldehyde dehydrogenase family protein [Fimbriimonas sp.]|nr:aldehyde dehydrogenase family protein [Fimbriimonas sp.]
MSSAPLILSSTIGGQQVSGSGGNPYVSLNPTNPSDLIAEFESASPAEVNRASTAALEAFGAWSRLAAPSRAEALYKWAEAIQGRAEELAQAIVREVGKPVGEARGEVGRCVAILRYYAGEAVRPTGDVIPALVSGGVQYSVRVPLGVVGLITPWNFPLAIPLWKAAPALAMGNCVVLKPAEESAWCAALLAETAEAAGLAGGVFNVVLGDGSTGAALLEDELVRAISFTGSAEVGAMVAQACARRNIKYQTEMGGKNPGIVLKDANLTQAAALIAGGAMRFAGQKCTATSRVLVDRSVSGAFVDELRSAIEALPIGDPANLTTAVGPVITEESQQRIRTAVAEGEKLYAGKAPDDGFFAGPAVIGTYNDSELSQKELFGPVLSFIEIDGLDEAISLANATPFGLSASLFTRDLTSAMSYIHRIEAGMVRVNADTTGVDPHAPFGGVKGSSSHSREQGPSAKEFYTEVRTVQINP